MEKSILKEIVYKYYPRKINSVLEKDAYKNSDEFKKLKGIIDEIKKDKTPKGFIELKQDFQKNHSATLINKTSFAHFDRCYCFQLIKNKSVFANIFVSFIIPYYLVKVNPHLSFIKDLNNSISQNIEERLNINKFPENIENQLIEDVSFQDIKQGKFTFLNAFFSDENI